MVEKNDIVEDIIQPTLIVEVFTVLIIWMDGSIRHRWRHNYNTAVVGRPDGRTLSQRKLVHVDTPLKTVRSPCIVEAEFIVRLEFVARLAFQKYESSHCGTRQGSLQQQCPL